MSSESARRRDDRMASAALLVISILFGAHKLGLPTWMLPVAGLFLAVPYTMLNDGKFALPAIRPRPISYLIMRVVTGSIIIGFFGCLAFIGKWLLGLGAPTQREIIVLLAAVLMLVGSSLLEVKRKRTAE